MKPPTPPTPRNKAFAALAVALALTPAAFAAEPSVGLDDRLELDGLFQSSFTPDPPGFHRPPEEFARAAPSATDRGAAPASDVRFEARAQILLRLGPAPSFDGLERVPRSVAAAIGDPAAVARWLAALRALARTKEAASTLARERKELEPALTDFRARLSSGAFVASMEKYAGLPLPGTHLIVLSPFHSASGVANVVDESPDGGVTISSLLGPERHGSSAAYWGRRTPGTLWHEEAHGVLDPLADAYASRIERARPEDPAAICYGEWRQCVREHVVRAVMIRLIELRLGRAAAEDQLAFEDPTRFRWLAAMLDRLKEYEADRRRYPTFADFYPRLLDAVRPEKDDGDAPFHAEQEPPAVRARLARLARTALPLMKDGEARRHLAAALKVAETVLPPTNDATAPGVRSDADPGPAPRRADAADLARRGVAAFESRRAAEALDLLDRALALEPDNPETSLSRAVVLESLGRAADALTAYAVAAAAARPRKDVPPFVLSDALGSHARLLLAAGRRDEARRELAEALAASPKDWAGRADAEALLKRAR